MSVLAAYRNAMLPIPSSSTSAYRYAGQVGWWLGTSGGLAWLLGPGGVIPPGFAGAGLVRVGRWQAWLVAVASEPIQPPGP